MIKQAIRDEEARLRRRYIVPTQIRKAIRHLSGVFRSFYLRVDISNAEWQSMKDHEPDFRVQTDDPDTAQFEGALVRRVFFED